MSLVKKGWVNHGEAVKRCGEGKSPPTNRRKKKKKGGPGNKQKKSAALTSGFKKYCSTLTDFGGSMWPGGIEGPSTPAARQK